MLFFSHQTQAYPTLTLFSVPGLPRVLGTWMVWLVPSQCYIAHLTWLVRSVITQLVWQYTHTLKEDLASFLPPHKKCKQLVKLDRSNLLQSAPAWREKPPKPPFNLQKESLRRIDHGSLGRYFSQIYLLSVETLMLLSRCFAILTSRQVWIWAAKSEPSSSQNSSELLWLPCVAQLPYLLHSAACLWAMMPKLSRCNTFNPQRPCYALQRGVLTVLHHSWKSFSVIRAKL